MKNLNDLLITTSVKLSSFKRQAKAKLAESTGDFAVDHGVVMVIVVALGAILLGLLIAYFKGDFSSNLKNNISNFFSQS